MGKTLRGKPAVFLDRDGVITREQGHICRIDEVELFPFVAESVEIIHQKGYLAIVITNQSGVARGIFSEKELLKKHKAIIEETGLDAIYYCPHHIQGKIEKYKVLCDCRKPFIGLIRQACRDFIIDLENSYVAGDRACDILTGINAGVKTVLLESGYGSKNLEEDVSPDYILGDLRDLAEFLQVQAEGGAYS